MRQALYRKYRPKTFSEVFGQDNIVNILKNQISNNQISHAYVFSGTRGTGKTSTAKIFAKAVNCLHPHEGNPCNECKNCQSILNEENMDIIEMDAASNRGIDDIRQLRDQVIYPPASLKYKVYIIDEAHMITREAFNALLKIMEEPPKHLIFILATTELDKIPDTILSRTQRFEFKSLSEADIRKQIYYILDKEEIKMEDRAVQIVANVASGAMRDALSILDQVISIGKTEITTSDVTDLLGIFSDEVKMDYTRAVFNKDVKGLLKLIDSELDKGKDPHNFIKDIISFFKDLIYIKASVMEDIFSGIAEDISLDQLINTADLLLEYEDLMKKSDSASLLFRMASIKIIDYMPRKQLEAKIINLEERLAFLEKNGFVENKKNDIIKKDSQVEETFTIEQGDNFLPEEDPLVSVERIHDEKIPQVTEEILGGGEDIRPNQEPANGENPADLLRKILADKFPPTNILFEGLKDDRVSGVNIVYYLDEEHLPMHLGMNFFITRALEDLEKKTGKSYQVKFELFKMETETGDDDKIEKLKELFPNGINIYDKK